MRSIRPREYRSNTHPAAPPSQCRAQSRKAPADEGKSLKKRGRSEWDDKQQSKKKNSVLAKLLIIVSTKIIDGTYLKQIHKAMVNAPLPPIFTGFEWDADKRAANISKHNVDFAAAEIFDFATALIKIDDRKNYGEVREIALGFIGERLHVLCYTRREPKVRVISLRRANMEEKEIYDAAS